MVRMVISAPDGEFRVGLGGWCSIGRDRRDRVRGEVFGGREIEGDRMRYDSRLGSSEVERSIACGWSFGRSLLFFRSPRGD